MATSLRVRPTSRVLLIDSKDRIFLQFFSLDGGRTGVWITPGGGIDEGESPEDCALRELAEEVGLTGVDLGPCVWHRNFIVDAWEGGQFEQQDKYFVCRVESYELGDFQMHDAGERSVTLEQRWWSFEEILASTDQRFAPTALTQSLAQVLVGDYPAEPLLLEG